MSAAVSAHLTAQISNLTVAKNVSRRQTFDGKRQMYSCRQMS